MMHYRTHYFPTLAVFLFVAGVFAGLFPGTATAQLNGNYTIGTGGSYTTFDAAINALTSSGVSGPVTFTVYAGSHTGPFTIPAIAGASPTNTITFDGGTGNAATRVLTYSTPSQYNFVLKLDGADYLRFKNLTIRATGSTYGYGVLFTNQANYNHFIACSIEASPTSTNTYSIAMLASSTTSYSSYGNWANHTLVEDCDISGGTYAVRFNGSSSSSTTIGLNNQFIGNRVTGFNSYGMYFYYQPALQVKYNTIRNRTTSTGSNYGIYSYYANEGAQIVGNDIQVTYNPLRSLYHNYARSSTSIRGLVANNMLVCTSTSTNYGLYVSYPRYTDVVYNSLNMMGGSTGYGIYNYGASTSYDNKYQNNIIAKQGSGTFYAIYNTYAADMSEFDYNIFWSAVNGAVTFRWNGTTYSSLATLQAAIPTKHQNSFWGEDPYFVANLDLHSRSHAGYQAGIAVSVITDDFDGDPRGMNPCIGADEYPAPPPEKDLAVRDVRLNYATDTWTRIEDAGMHDVNVVLENTGLGADPANISVTYKVGGMPATEFDGVSQVFNPVWTNHASTVTFTQQITGLSASPSLTVYARVFWAQDEDGANDGGGDTRKIDIEKVHGRESFNSMSAPEFSDFPGYLDYPWTVNNNNGGETWNVASGVGTAGSNAVEYPGDGQAADDWFFSPAMDLFAGSSYRVAFNMKSVSGTAQTVEVAFGTSPDPGSMSTFATFSNFTNTGFMTAKQLAGGLDPYFNTPLVNGLYFIGFRVSSAAGAGAVVIDDIVVADNPSPPPKIAFGMTGDPLNTFIDNPDSKILVQANYKSPGLITRTYEVVSNTNIYGANGDFLWDVETTTPWITLTKATPEPTLQGYNLNPPRPRQFQDFTMTVNPNGLAPGLHVGQITFYGILFNDDFPPPANGLIATNEPLTVDVELRIISAGTKIGPDSEEASYGIMTAGNTYQFNATGTGNPIATVEVTSGVINGMTIRTFPNQLPLNLARMLYVKRYWQITHTGTGWTANVTFPYSDQEATMVNDRNQLRGVRQAVPRGMWEDPIMGTSSASDPAMNLVKVFDFNELNIGGNIALAQPYFIYGKVGDGIPTNFGIERNYPNPFISSTSITFNMAEERAVRLVVYNSLGMEVAELVNDVVGAGRYSVQFDASALPTGTYICRMTAGDFVQSTQMVLSK